MTTTKDRYFLSHSPCRQNDFHVWFKSVKDSNSIGGRIIANAFGKTKQEAEKYAEIIKNALNQLNF